MYIYDNSISQNRPKSQLGRWACIAYICIKLRRSAHSRKSEIGSEISRRTTLDEGATVARQVFGQKKEEKQKQKYRRRFHAVIHKTANAHAMHARQV